MTDLDLPLHGPALYNPHLLSKEELLGLFSARQTLLEELIDDLRSTPPGESAQHHLILGQRGMGKTMLLRRVQFAVEDDPELSQTWLALSFPEEQYNVAALSDFWLNCIDALSDTLERLGSPLPPEKVEKVVEGLDAAVEALHKQPEDERANHALDVLVSAASTLDRRLLLLVDNADLVLDRIGEQDWSLREVLSSQPAVTFLGASAAAVESTYEYGKAFYDFFRIHNLTGLTVDETQGLLLQYAEAQENDAVRTIVEEDPGRLRTLHTLTGGNPRTLVLLFNIFVKGPDGDVRSDIEQLLDQCTPLYKARFETLPPQAQQVVDALALHWDPVSAGELAETLRMPVNNVSAQLNRLVSHGVVEKVPYEPESKTGFQIAERFFNIWYLMRASRRVRRRLLWLVEFLRMFYSQDELRRRVERHLRLAAALTPRDRLRHAEYSFALASAVGEGSLRSILERSALQMLISHEELRSEVRNLIELEHESPGLRTRAEYLERFHTLRIQLRKAVDQGKLMAQVVDDLLKAPFRLEQKESLVEGILEIEGATRSPAFTSMVSAQENFFAYLTALRASDEGLELTFRALEAGHMTSFDDIEGAQIAEAAFGVRGIIPIVAAMRCLEDDDEDLEPLVTSLKDSVSPVPWLVWLAKCGRAADSVRLQHALDRVWDLAGDNPELLLELGSILDSFTEMPEEAERAIRRAIEVEPTRVEGWTKLAAVLEQQRRVAEAIDAYRKITDLQPEDSKSWNRLARALRVAGLTSESEAAVRKALDLDSNVAAHWVFLAVLFDDQDRVDEAENALREATRAEPTIPATWQALQRFLWEKGREDKAEQALRSGLKALPADATLTGSLARLLFDGNRGLGEAEQLARKASSSEDEEPQDHHTLACVLVRRGKWAEALEPARRFLDVWVPDLPDSLWTDVITFFREAVTAGRAREAAELLDEQELGERWRPLREALEALARNNPKYLRRVAPEVRGPAEAILKELSQPPEVVA